MGINDFKKLFTFFFICSIFGACASHSRPNLYPNEVLKARGPVKAQEDIDQCLKDADTYLDTPEGKKVASGGLSTTAVGLGVGFGTGGVGIGAGVGTGRVVSGTDVKRGFVNQCLENKGYQVLVWE